MRKKAVPLDKKLVEGVEVVSLYDGYFKVYKNGIITRLNRDFIEVICPISYTSRDKRYQVVSHIVNGKQTNKYVHRLIAEAFIPNPENKPEVNHINGIYDDNSLENLEWATRHENAQHMHDIKLWSIDKWGRTCKYCKGKTGKKIPICPNCQNELDKEEERQNRIYRLCEQYYKVDLTRCKPVAANVIQLRMRGYTLQEIGDELGFTREYARQLLKNPYRKNNINSSDPDIEPLQIFERLPHNKITDFMKSKRVKLSEMARLIEVSPSTFRYKLNDVDSFKIKELKEISNFFDVSLEDLIS